jgi:hypothetical protein
VTGVAVYETYKPGSLVRISAAAEYTDDNTIACCGEDFPPNSPCTSRPTCSQKTVWNTLWEGTATSAGGSARVYQPPVCPFAQMANLIRLDFDTVGAPGWNNFDAVQLIGHLTVPGGLVLPDPTAAASVEYTPRMGVHGVDRFTFTTSDCLAYGAPSTVNLTLPAPAAAFVAPPYASYGTSQRTSNVSLVKI